MLAIHANPLAGIAPTIGESLAPHAKSPMPWLD